MLSYLADLTPWGGLAIVVIAIMIALKKGVKLIPVPKDAKDNPGNGLGLPLLFCG